MKLLKRLILSVVVLIGIGIAIIYFYKDTLIKKFITDFNDNYNITIAYKDTELNLFKNFPNVNVAINKLSVVNDDSKDTLFVSNKMYLALNIKDLFKNKNEEIVLQDLLVEKAKVNLVIDKEGKASFDVKNLHETSNNTASTESSKASNDKPIKISVEKYALTDTDIIFDDLQGNMFVAVKNLNHSGKGDFKGALMDLDTKTTIDALTVSYANVKYFNKAKIALDAVLGMDLDNMKFTFKENNAKINDLVLKFDGFIDMNDTNQEYDVSFSAPSANFKSVLSLVPSAYSSDFSGVSASGIANVNGVFKGILSDTEFPKYDVRIKTDNASFKYPDLPKSITNIYFDGIIASKTTTNDVFLDIKNLKFTIDKDVFTTKGKITKITTNPTVNASFDGTLNLGNLSKAYPIALEEKLEGVLKAHFTTQADQKSIDKNQFEKIKTNGTASLEGFSYSGKDIANPIHISNATIKFNTNSMHLSDFNAQTGKSDIEASGKLDNLYAFMFNDKKLQGNFNVSSNNFEVADFLMEETTSPQPKSSEKKETTATSTSAEALKIPDFLDINTNFKANRVVYDNVILKNVSGGVRIKDQKVKLTNTKASMLGGQITFNGDIDTKNTPASFDLDMDINKFDIANSFNTLETFQKIAPIAKALKGRYTTTFKLKGNLDDEFSPVMNSLSGDAFAQLLVNNINKTELPLLNSLASNLNFIDFNNIDFSKIKAALSFENGRVSVKPFDIKHNDIVMHVSGSHGFDTSLKYNITMDVPAKYLGKEAVNLLSKLSNMDKNTITVPLSSAINGTLTQPSIKVNFKQAMTNLTSQIVAYQKQQLTNQATDKTKDVINDLLKNNGVKTDSTASGTDKVIEEGVKGLLDLFGKKKGSK